MRRDRAMTLFAALALTACASEPLSIACEHDRECPSELACGGERVCGSGPVTRVFVIAQLSFPGVTDGTHARGFDLDGVVSDGTGTGCVERAMDYVSLDDPSVTGVDGAMAALLPTLAMLVCAEGAPPEQCIEEQVARSIASGITLVAIELGELDSWRDDAEVDVIVHRARVPGCGSCAPMLDGEVLAADQRFALEPMAAGAGAIVEGVLRASLDGPIRIDIRLNGGTGLDLVLRDARLEARLDAAGLHDAVLGGGFALDDVGGHCDPGPCEIPSPLSAFADLDPDPADPTSCRRFSVTVTFSAIPTRGPR